MQREDSPEGGRGTCSRRELLGRAAGAAALGTATWMLPRSSRAARAPRPPALKGRIRQSLCNWCYADYWDLDAMCGVAKDLGCVSIELLTPEKLSAVKRHGLTCAITSIDMNPDPPFAKGFNNPRYHDRLIAETRRCIDAAAEHGSPNVICFTGFAEDIPADVGARNCVDGFKKIIGYAEKKKVNLCLEMLNSRVSDHPMKGHPGYQGDHTDYCVDIIKRVGSPRMKLLFDIYHVQIMDGDIITRIRQYAEHIGHVHTAGNPGRGELDEKQEINYKPIMEALVEVKYKGYVGQEFLPTRDPLDGLRAAVAVCDV